MKLRVIHETRYDYTPAVETAQHIAHLRPRSGASQQLLSHALTVTPKPAQQSEALDVYGNARCFFSLQTAHDELRVVADSVAVTAAQPQPHCELSWEQVREHFRYHAGSAYDPAAEFVFASPYVPRHDEFATYARPCFGPGTPLPLAARDLMERIHREFSYESESTEVHTPALQALAQRKGVCQDFAHIMVACFRSIGLPARYVSGYLLTQPSPGQPRLVGSDASHAWVAVYAPGEDGAGHWFDFDPTNNRTPGEDYVTLATGRDYSDVAPLRGVIHGGAQHTLHVAVTVTPVSEDSPDTTKEPQS